MKRKVLCTLMAASMMSAALAGNVSFAAESEPVTLSVWAPFTGSDGDVMQPMMEKILSGEDVTECLQAASDTLDGVIAAQ